MEKYFAFIFLLFPQLLLAQTGGAGAPASSLDSFFLPFFCPVCLTGLKGRNGLKGKKRDKCFVLLWNERSNKSSVRLSRQFLLTLLWVD